MTGLPTIAKHAKEHGIEPLKKLGQNFIFDSTLCDKIARTAHIHNEDIVIEIGPGTAGLTRAILNFHPKKLIAIERDHRCIALLSEINDIYPNLKIIEADALKITIKDILNSLQLENQNKVKIIANLPYNIATSLMLNWFVELEYIESINIMVQKEVAERIISPSGNKTYGRLSVICQLLNDANKLFDVSPDAFYPKPKIWSSIISLKPKKNRPSNEEIKLVEKITHAAFSMRRKMLKTSLKLIVPQNIIDETNHSLRAENLTPVEYLNLANKIMLLNFDKMC